MKVNVGEVVEKGATVVVLEAMKMEYPVVAPSRGTVTHILVTQSQLTQQGDVLLVMEESVEVDVIEE